jgi:glycerol-3-phosphate dehydrogenase
MRVHELVGWDRNRGLLADRTVSKGRIHGRKAVSQALGKIWGEEPPPAAVWSDGQMLDADRLILECIVAAEGSGAVIGNYVEAIGLQQTRDGDVAGLEVRDTLNMHEFRIRANNVVLAAGPWIAKLADAMSGDRVVSKHARQIRNMNIVVPQKLAGRAIGIDSEQKSDAVVGKSNRLFFMTPWRNCSVIGTTHEPYDGDPNDYKVTEDEVSDFVSEVSEACPPLDLKLSEVQYVYAGLTPSDGEDGSPARSRSAEVVDHGSSGGTRGVYSIIGVKYTTARSLAERTVDLIGRESGNVQPSRTATSPLPGARGMASMRSLLEQIRAAGPMDEDEVSDLAIAYGTRFRQVLKMVEGPLTPAAIFAARVRLAVREEMAQKIEDVALRRLDWMPRGFLDKEHGRVISQIMASELGWTAEEEERNFSAFSQELRDGVLTPSWSSQ